MPESSARKTKTPNLSRYSAVAEKLMAEYDPNRVFVDTTKVKKTLRGFGTVDLFAGAGGMSLGFQQAGFKILSAVEVVDIAAETHHLNFLNF